MFITHRDDSLAHGLLELRLLLRVLLEPPISLEQLAGAWPAALVMGGAALSMAKRVGDVAGGVLRAMAFQLALLLFLAWLANALTPRLLAVLAGAFVIGLAIGALYPLEKPQRGAAGWVLGGLALLLFAGAAYQGSQRPSAPYVPGEVRLPELEEVKLGPLEVALSFPRSWSESPQEKPVDCGDCGATATFPPTKLHSPIPKPKTCEKCGEEVLHGPRRHVFFVDSGSFLNFSLFAQHVLVWSAPRGPYDAPDTLATRILDQLRENPGFRRAIIDEEGFSSSPLGEGYRLTLRDVKQQGTTARARLYVFVDRKRTIFLRFLGGDPGDPPRRDSQDALWEAIANSLRRLTKAEREALRPEPEGS